jgi:hypothetical protein
MVYVTSTETHGDKSRSKNPDGKRGEIEEDRKIWGDLGWK